MPKPAIIITHVLGSGAATGLTAKEVMAGHGQRSAQGAPAAYVDDAIDSVIDRIDGVEGRKPKPEPLTFAPEGIVTSSSRLPSAGSYRNGCEKLTV